MGIIATAGVVAIVTPEEALAMMPDQEEYIHGPFGPDSQRRAENHPDSVQWERRPMGLQKPRLEFNRRFPAVIIQFINGTSTSYGSHNIAKVHLASIQVTSKAVC